MAKRRQGGQGNGNQRKRRDEGDSEESNTHQLDPVFGQYRALPISKEKLESVTSNTIPQDAETYLATVRLQAESGSSVMFVTKEINYDEEPKEQITRTTSKEEERIETEDQKRLKEHQEHVLAKYKEQRESLPPPGELNIPSSFRFPENFTEWRAYVMKNEPVVSLISNLDHELNIRLIIYCTRWLNNTIPEQISSWVFALLVRLSDLLESSETATVRDLAIRAKKINAKGGIVSQLTRATNDMIILIVSRVFGQRDLEL